MNLQYICNTLYKHYSDIFNRVSEQNDCSKALSHGELFFATCNAILLLGE